jgi:hypothetical protein
VDWVSAAGAEIPTWLAIAPSEPSYDGSDVDSAGQKLAFVYFEGGGRPASSGEAAHQRRGAADCAHWLKVKNPKAPAVKREAEEDRGSVGT